VNLVADEDVDGPVVQRLRNDGHDIIYVADLSPGVTDDDVLRQANDRGALLLTADKDFGELVFRQRLVHSGVLLLRLAGLTNVTKAEKRARPSLRRPDDPLPPARHFGPGLERSG